MISEADCCQTKFHCVWHAVKIKHIDLWPLQGSTHTNWIRDQGSYMLLSCRPCSENWMCSYRHDLWWDYDWVLGELRWNKAISRGKNPPQNPDYLNGFNEPREHVVPWLQSFYFSQTLCRLYDIRLFMIFMLKKNFGVLWWLPLEMLTLTHFPCYITYLLRIIKAPSRSLLVVLCIFLCDRISVGVMESL